MDDQNEQHFYRILLEDVAAALNRHDRDVSQNNKRDVVRTCFVAIEGAAWFFREHIIAVCGGLMDLDPEENLILSETQQPVDEAGYGASPKRTISIVENIRLIARIAERFTPAAKIDFSKNEWNRFRQAIRIRNRITHPKTAADLTLSDNDLLTSLDAFYWFLQQSGNAMSATNHAAGQYIGNMKDILKKLNAGDPQTLAEYQAAARAIQEEE